MNKSTILLGSALGFALMFGQGTYATDESSSPIESYETQDKDHIDKREHKVRKFHKRHGRYGKYRKHNCKVMKKKLEHIIKRIAGSESLFEEAPAKYFKWMAFRAGIILRAYKRCEYTRDCGKNCIPSAQHVKTVKLYATMFEAWANAAKGKDKIDQGLISAAHDKVPELIASAKYLIKNCCKKSTKKSKPEEKAE